MMLTTRSCCGATLGPMVEDHQKGGNKMSDIRARAAEGIRSGDVFTAARTFTESDTEQFARLSRDFNPVHDDDRFVAAKKLPRKICHGLLVGSLITEIGGQIGWLASGMEFRFLKPVFFNDTITCELTVREIKDRLRAHAAAVFRNQHGTVVMTATLSGYLPDQPERRVLQQMLEEEKSE
jgi:3-hydroxybutyryl-CoA dehydratase